MIAKFIPCPTLETERLVVRPMTRDDAPAVFAMRATESISRYLDRTPYTHIDQAYEYIDRMNAGIAQNEFISWCIVRKGEQAPFGGICLWNLEHSLNRAEIGYEMRPDYEGHGYMSEAVRAVTAYGFEVMALDAVEGSPSPDNLRSCRLLERCGFTREPALRITPDAKGAPFPMAVYTKRKPAPYRRILTTERLLLRENIPADFDALCGLLRDDQVMYAWEHAFSEEEVRDWISRQLSRYQNDGIGLWALIERRTGAFLGQAGLVRIELDGRAETELGWLLMRRHWHKGYATEAGLACKDYAFTALGCDRVVCTIRDNNDASQRVAHRVGLVREGSFVKQYYNRDMPHNIYVARRREEPYI